MRFKQITFVHCQAVSHAENQNLKVLLRYKKLREITKKLITKVQKVQQTM